MSGLGDFAKVIAEGKKAKKEAEEKSVSHQALKSLEESVKVNNPFRATVKIETRTEQVPITLHEEQPIQPAKITPDDYVRGAVTSIDHLVKENNSFQQPNPTLVAPELKSIQDKLKYLESWLGKVSIAGPGSGEVNLRYLDDVNTSNLGHRRLLNYNSQSSKFEFIDGIDFGPIDSLKLNLAGTQSTKIPGMLTWNNNEDCLDIVQSDGSTLQVGLENYIQVRNGTNDTLENGTFVMFSGVNGNQVPLCEPFLADGSYPSLYSIGVLTNSIEADQIGRATILGKVRDLDTTGDAVGESWDIGDLLWAHPSIPGKLTNVRPTAPRIAVSVAVVLKADATDGVLLVRPTIFPKVQYGSFYDTNTHFAPAPNTPYPVGLNTIDVSNGFTIQASDTYPTIPSKVVAYVQGLYNFQFSIQTKSTTSSTANIWIWYRKNNQDVPHSATQLSAESNKAVIVAAWNFIVSMNEGDWFELMWATDNVAMHIDAPAATAFCPATPSTILTVTQVSL